MSERNVFGIIWLSDIVFWFSEWLGLVFRYCRVYRSYFLFGIDIGKIMLVRRVLGRSRYFFVY